MQRAASLTAITVPLALLVACGGSGEPAGSGAAVVSDAGPRDTLVVASMSDVGNLNPIVYETANDGDILGALMLGPLHSRFDCGIAHEPGLYASWAWSEDGRTLTYTLRDDVKWSDGRAVTADDVAFTYELVRDPAVASPRLSMAEHIEPGSPRALDAQTVEFRFTRAYDRTTMMSHTGLSPLPKHVFESADRGTLRGHPASLSPVVTGPFSVAKHDKGSRLVLEPNAAWTGPEALRPRLKRVVFEVIPEYATRLIKLTNGEVDFMDAINVEDADRLKEKAPHVRIVPRGYRSSDYVAWNTKHPLFEDAEVRRALTMAIDVEGMMAKLMRGADGTIYAKRAVGTITPELCRVHNDAITPLPYDLEAAKAKLAAAGWRDSNGDGWLDKDGRTFSFTLATNAGNKRRADTSILVQAALKQVGVRVNLEQRESNVFFEALRKRDFDAALAGWSAALFVDPAPIWKCDAPDKKQEFNFTGYCNPDVDRLIDQGLSTPDPEASLPLWHEVQARIYEDQPYTFLWWQQELVGVSERFLDADKRINVLSRVHDLHEWEVPADKVKYKR